MQYPDELIKSFFKNYPVSHLGKGQIMFRPGDQINKVPYLELGQVIQYHISPAGNLVVVNAYKPGAFFPMSSVINKSPTNYFFEAATPSTVRLAPANHVLQFLEDNPEVVLDLLSRVYSGVDGILKRMAHLMGGSARSRLVYELINAGYRFGELNPDGSRFIKMSENDIAQRSGLSRETVNRAGKQLKAENLVKITNRGIVIPDINALELLLESIE